MTELSVNKFLKHMFLEGNIHTEIWVKFEVTFVEIIQPSINKIGIKKYKPNQLCLFKIYPHSTTLEARFNITLRRFKSYDFPYSKLWALFSIFVLKIYLHYVMYSIQ